MGNWLFIGENGEKGRFRGVTFSSSCEWLCRTVNN